MQYLQQIWRGVNGSPQIAGMAKLADAADLKSAGPKGLWGFDSPSRHQQFDVKSYGRYLVPPSIPGPGIPGFRGAERIRPRTDATAGVAMGCLALGRFATAAWKVLPHLHLWESLTLATGSWTIIAVTAWIMWRRLR